MQYLCLIYDDEKQFDSATDSAKQEVMGAYMAFTQAIKDAGVYVAGEALQATDTATTLRVRDGKTLKTDGPFAETKEQLGGYYLLECKNLDQAIEWAAKIPSAKFGSIEVRPIMCFD